MDWLSRLRLAVLMKPNDRLMLNSSFSTLAYVRASLERIKSDMRVNSCLFPF